jgi:hypothetical protein
MDEGQIAARILVLGNATAGKTTLVKRLCSDDPPARFSLQKPASTVGCRVDVKRLSDGRFLEFREVGGRPAACRSRSVFYTCVEYDGLMLVYDMTNSKSVEGIRRWIKELRDSGIHVNLNQGELDMEGECGNLGSSALPFILVGTKADLNPPGPPIWSRLGQAELPGFTGNHVHVSAVNFDARCLSSFFSAAQRHCSLMRSSAAPGDEMIHSPHNQVSSFSSSALVHRF